MRQLALSATLAALIAATFAGCAPSGISDSDIALLNASYEPTRRFYSEVNNTFAAAWRAEHGRDIVIYQSHAGSGAQARAVSFGLAADVVTLALAYDIDAIAERAKLLPADWQKRLPDNSAPYTSTIVFLVRKGNPKQIHDWPDLARPGISVVTPNPKTSGGARWNYLAAWGYALRQYAGDEDKARSLLAGIYRNAPVLDTGARGATVTFARRGIGDVLIAWENEALLLTHAISPDEFQLVLPSLSVLAEPPVAVVDAVVDKRGTRNAAQAYLQFLYSPAGQQLAAKHYFRPRLKEVSELYAGRFPDLDLMSIADFGSWSQIQKTHFSNGGMFDRIYPAGS
jgi:sulfate/thiosulfate transport system substrate-binding protein